MSLSEPSASGHRARLRERLLLHGGATLQDYEILEYLLALAIPRRDTKPIAKALIARFGSVPAVLTADPDALRREKGVGDTAIAALKIAHAASQRLLQTQTRQAPVLANWQALLDYLHVELAHNRIEQFRVLFLDTRNRLIRDEIMSEGSIDETAVYVREIVRRALELAAASLILVHNHPSGDPSPSRADIDITRKLVEAARTMGIAVHDHIILGSQGHASLRALGLI